MRRTDSHKLWIEGRKLSAEGAKALESSLANHPDDVRTRIRLLGYYSIDLRGSVKERNRHSLWLIEHRPDLDLSMFTEIDEILSPEAHAEAARLWRAALEQRPSNQAVLKAASTFFTFSDREFSKELLRRGAVLEPDGADWHESIGNLCMLDVDHEEPQGVAMARQALAEFQKALDLEPSESNRYGLIIKAAKAASFANNFEAATAFATRVLEDAPKFKGTWIHGNGLHHAHIVLGRVALARDDIQSAKEHLLASVDGPTSPQLSSFGPDQQLAVALVARGERDAVLAYAEACKHKFGASLGLLGSLYRAPDGEPPRLQVVRDTDGKSQ